MAGISRDVIDQIRSACDIVDLIDSYVPLKRTGHRAKCCCPFHKEKTPSFNVDGAKGFFKCFGCGVSGDAFKFVQLYDNLDFPGAIRRLSERTGIAIPEESSGPSLEEKSQREKLLNVMAAVATWWQRILLKDPAGEAGRHYLKSRDISADLAKEFGIGIAPDGWTATTDWGREHGYSPEIMDLAGLIAANEDTGRRYDRFRGRLMFPIRNENGQVVAFSGRLLDPEAKAAKYVNSPETPLFSKSKILYGLDKTKRAILEVRRAIICEGQIDLIRCFEHGITNIVAPQGTAFTEHHARLLKRYADEVILCFDSDRAGQNAAARSVDLLLEHDLEVRIASMPPGEDPDTMLRKQGAEALRSRLDAAPDYTKHLLELYCREQDPASPRGRTSIAQKMAEVVVKIPSPVRQQTVALEVATRLQIPVNLFEQEMARVKTRSSATRAAASLPDAAPPEAVALTVHPLTGHLLSLLLNHPEIIPHIQRTLHTGWLESLEGGKLVQDLLDSSSFDEWEEPAAFVADRLEEERNLLATLLLQPHPIPEEFSIEAYANELVLQVHRRGVNRRIQIVEQEIKSNLLSPMDLIKKSKELIDLRNQRI